MNVAPCQIRIDSFSCQTISPVRGALFSAVVVVFLFGKSEVISIPGNIDHLPNDALWYYF